MNKNCRIRFIRRNEIRKLIHIDDQKFHPLIDQELPVFFYQGLDHSQTVLGSSKILESSRI